MYCLPLLCFAFGFLSVVKSQYNERCADDKMRRCRDNIDRNIQKRINDMSRQDMMSHCNYMREEFNCLLQQTTCLSSEEERKKNGNTLRNGLTYIRDGCDSLSGSWKDSSCYIGDGMKTCESSFPVRSGHTSYNDENCRKYTQFYECVLHNLKNRCRPDDDRFLGQYLIDRAQELAWTCQYHSSGQLTDYDRGGRDRGRDREYDNGRGGGDGYDRYGSSSNRDRYRDDHRQSDRLPADRYDTRYSSDRRGGHDDRYASDRNYGYSNSNYGYGSDSNREICCQREYCSRSRMEECKDSLVRVIDERQSSTSGSGYQQDERKCRNIRNDFNCLLWQTTCLSTSDRDRNSDVFRRARDYISRTCDTYGRWNENSCYKSNEMQRCETYLSNTRSGANFEACRSFNRFKECMNDALRNCAKEDELYHGAYLIEKAAEMSWQCSNPDSDRRGDGDRDRDRDRDRYSSSQDRRNDYSGASYGSYEGNEHLDDDDEMCVSRMQNYVETCKRELEEKRRQLIIENDFDEKQKGQCCATRRYQTCLLDATRRVCQRERRRVVDSLMGRYRPDLETTSCRRIYDSECSSSSITMASTILTVFILALLCGRHSAMSLF